MERNHEGSLAWYETKIGSGARIEPDGTVRAFNAVAAQRASQLDYDSLIVDAHQFETLWPKKDALADKKRHQLLRAARKRGLDASEIRKLS
jgi:hypothetical protein